jgi:hypothetical protein
MDKSVILDAWIRVLRIRFLKTGAILGAEKKKGDKLHMQSVANITGASGLRNRIRFE